MTDRLRVAIVGSGISGCSAAAFVRGRFPTAAITVLERDAWIGGRVRTLHFRGCTVEAGAGFFHSSNTVTMELVRRLDLPLTERERLPDHEATPVGVWDGERFVVMFASNKVKLAVDLLRQYGLSVVRMRQLAREMLRRWRRVYELQTAGAIFDSPASLLQALDLHCFAQQTSYDLLARARVSTAVVREIFNGISRSIYNQDACINAFAGMTALVGAGLAGGRTLTVSGGNDQLCRGLLKLARATVRTGCQVTVIRRAGGTARDFMVLDDAGGLAGSFDVVVLAVPRGQSPITIDDGGGGAFVWDSAPHTSQTTYVTCVAGCLRVSSFGLRTEDDVPQVILTTECDRLPFSSIVRRGPSDTAGEYVYKIQSRERLTPEGLDRLFVKVRDVSDIPWHNAYPTLTPGEGERAFRVSDRLYYPGALEPVVSTLETQLVGSRNVAGMLQRDAAVGGVA